MLEAVEQHDVQCLATQRPAALRQAPLSSQQRFGDAETRREDVGRQLRGDAPAIVALRERTDELLTVAVRARRVDPRYAGLPGQREHVRDGEPVGCAGTVRDAVRHPPLRGAECELAPALLLIHLFHHCVIPLRSPSVSRAGSSM